MHTSEVLQASDFHYWCLKEAGLVQVDFDAFCPQYHEQDRVGIVSPSLESGVFSASYAILAITTAFYDVLRSRSVDFFDYPHHFALLDVSEEGAYTQGRRVPLDLQAVGAPWSALDVWPDSNWILAADSVGGMLKTVFDCQINRLFWPEDFKPAQEEHTLPTHVRQLLRARLKAVYYYNAVQPNLEIRVRPSVEKMVQSSIGWLPDPGEAQSARLDHAIVSPRADGFTHIERYAHVSVQAFLAAMDPCFAD
jgi:hypothetical protein